MTLASRVSFFFLGSLALTLAGFSAALYFLAARHLDRQLDQRLESALAALTAAVEIKDDGVEWEPHQRRLDLPGVRWLARDPSGRAVGSSAEPLPEGIAPPADGRGGPIRESRTASGGESWRVSQVVVRPADPPRPQKHNQSGNHQQADHDGNTLAALVLTAAAPVGPNDAALRWLAWTLAGLCVAVWSVAALVGGRLCRRSLAPVAWMAQSARSIQASEPARRLEVPATNDELEELGRSFNGLLDRLQEAFERQRRFTGEASHQLRTPLAVMLGQVEVALRRERPPEEYRRVLGVVAEQAGRLHRVVEMLLFLARADAEAALPDVEPLPMRPWLRECLKSWAGHPRAADLRAELGDDEPSAAAHAPLLGQALDALIDNATKYSPPGSPVVVSLRTDGASVLLCVEDSGCGIDPEDLPRLFEPFFRSPRQSGSNPGGVGLGLAIARRAVEAMGGTLSAASGPEGGSRFVVSLPRVAG
jgi:signal transduction histidine kinase